MAAMKMSVFVFLLLMVSSKSELFTALVDLERLLFTEGEVVKTLENYLEMEERRLQKVRRFREECDQLYNRANNDVETFLSNPVNAYLLVKRLTADWKAMEDLVEGRDSRALIENITMASDLHFPDEEDLSGAAIALMRLQDTYKLDTASLAKGHIEGTKPSPELTAGDCFELGKQAFDASDYYHCLLWMQEALDRNGEEEPKTASKPDILEYLAFSYYMQGNMRYALNLTEAILELVPDHANALGNLKFFVDAVNQLEKRRGDDGDETTPSSIMPQVPVLHITPDKEVYERLCRGEVIKINAGQGELYCHFVKNGNPVLLLQHVKQEELFLNPRIVVYHDVLSEREMEVIKTLAQPRLKRATVQNAQSGDLETASYRISKSAWLKDEDHEVVSRVSQRIEDITGLTLSTAEELQVVNYGIGGHYEAHYDFAMKHEVNAFKNLGTGNRIATWLNYMSDVESGGATVFPLLGIGVKPRKGSAAFWYNLHKNGEGDMRTRHAACPVLVGSKWVSNKWLHVKDQEFRRKCGLNPEE